MAFSSGLLMLLQLCSIKLMLEARPACRLQGDLIQSAHHLLRDLVPSLTFLNGRPFPDYCMIYNTNISFPGSTFRATTSNFTQCHRALWVVYESLQEVEKIFEDYDLPVGEGGVTWDNQKLDNFRNLQSQLVQEGSCLSSVDGSGVLSSYFSNVTAVLQQQDSAACGWMALRRDLLGVLEFAPLNHRTCFTWRDQAH